jgi:hypothetical protein
MEAEAAVHHILFCCALKGEEMKFPPVDICCDDSAVAK